MMPGPLDPNSQQQIMAQILGSPQLMSQIQGMGGQGMSGQGMMGAPPPPQQSMMNAAAPNPMQVAAQAAAQQQGQAPVAPGMPGNPVA